MSSEDECLSPLMSIRPAKSSLFMRTPQLSKPEKSSVSNPTPIRNRPNEQFDSYKTPEAASCKKVTAAFLFSSCKKTRNSDALPKHTVIVGDSSEDEEQFQDSFKHISYEKSSAYAVEDSITEFSLIRKWLLTAEDSSDSESENPDDCNSPEVKRPEKNQKQITSSKDQNEQSIILLSSSEGETTDLVSEYENLGYINKKEISHVAQAVPKHEESSSGLYDSFLSASPPPIRTLHEKFKLMERAKELVGSTSSEDEGLTPFTSTKLQDVSTIEIFDTPEKDTKKISKYFTNSPMRRSNSPIDGRLTGLGSKLNTIFGRTTNASTTHNTNQTFQKSANLLTKNILVESSDEENVVPLSSKLATWRKRQQRRELETSDEEIDSSNKKEADLPKQSEVYSTRMPTHRKLLGDEESDLEDMFVNLTVTKVPVSKPKKTPKPRRKKKTLADSVDDLIHSQRTVQSTFLSSLSVNHPSESRHPEALPFIRGFKKTRDELTCRLFQLFNQVVFDSQLQRDFSITWNNRLTRTAGYCRHFTKRENGAMIFESRIELSTKVVDTPCRLRDTLVHELCHAATWTIDNCRGGHGPMWRKWANRALKAFPELPPITRCHNYEITYKYYYNCTVCSFSTGRHSKSVDTATHVCPMCRGRLELSKEPNKNATSGDKSDALAATPAAPKTPRTPNAFAMFVKENYATVKASRSDMPHAAVMKVLSAKFAESKKQSV